MKSFLKKQGRAAVIAGSMTFLAAAQATTVSPTSFTEMVSQADVIVTGQVQSQRCEWRGTGSERRIVTIVTLEVQAAHKGAPPARLELQFLGGTVGDTTLEVSGVPQFKIGEKSILFVEKNGKKFCPLAGIYHGKLTIEREAGTGREILVRHNRQPLTDVREIGADDGTMARAAGADGTRQPLSVGAFVGRIGQELGKPSP